MLVWIVTIFLVLIAVAGWLFLKKDPDHYIHEKSSPINFFFKWGHLYHHFFKVAIIVAFMIIIFSLYKYLLNTSNIFAVASALVTGVVFLAVKNCWIKAFSSTMLFLLL